MVDERHRGLERKKNFPAAGLACRPNRPRMDSPEAIDPLEPTHPRAGDRVQVGTMRLVLASAAWVHSAAESGMKPTVPFFIWMRNQLPVIPVTRTNLRR
jgi:hypothetical protein